MTFAARSVGMGGAGPVNPLAGGSASNTTFDPINAVARWRWNSDGTVDRRVGGTYTYSHNWYLPTTPGIGSSFFIHRSAVTGTALTLDDVGTAGTTNISVAREVGQTTSAIETRSSSLTINITSASGTTPIVASGDYSLYAERGL